MVVALPACRRGEARVASLNWQRTSWRNHRRVPPTSELLSLPSAAAIDATDAETLANVIEILATLERRLNRCRETSLLRSAIGHLRKFESDRAAVAS